jgi:hypothetical protein
LPCTRGFAGLIVHGPDLAMATGQQAGALDDLASPQRRSDGLAGEIGELAWMLAVAVVVSFPKRAPA